MSSHEKKAFLNERLKFSIFKDIETTNKDLLKECTINLKNIQKSPEYVNYNHNIDILIDELADKNSKYEHLKHMLETQSTTLNNQKNNLYEQLKSVDDRIISDLFGQLKPEDNKIINNSLDKITNCISTITQKLQKIKVEKFKKSCLNSKNF